MHSDESPVSTENVNQREGVFQCITPATVFPIPVIRQPQTAPAILVSPIDDTSPACQPSPLEQIRSSLGRPHLGFALVWTALLVVAQLVIGLGLGIAFFVFGAIQSGGLNTDGDVSPDVVNGVSDNSLSWLMAIGTGTTLVISLIAARWMLGQGLKHRLKLYSLSLAQWMIIILLVVPLQILASEVSNWMSELVPSSNGPMFASLSQMPWLFVLVVMCVFPGVGEEIFFRGFLSRGLLSRHGVFWGTVFTSFLFGAVHVDPVQASGAMALGVALQIVYELTGSLIAPITIHILNNALAFLAMRHGSLIPIDGITVSSDDQVLHTPWWILISSAIFTLLLLGILRRMRVDFGTPTIEPSSESILIAENPQIAT